MRSEETLKRILLENILPFWHPEVLDRENGGYRLNHDLEGKWRGPSDKGIVTQARTVWFFSRLVNAGLGTEEHIEAARHGYEFLRDRMWDPEFGGFYWSVDATGTEATMPDKHLYGQSFGLYALSEYAMASGDTNASELARVLFALLEAKAHDSQHGGYQEGFKRNWDRPPAGELNYMHAAPGVKLQNTHLHLVEGITTYYQATQDPIAAQRLAELVLVLSGCVFHQDVGACSDKFNTNWTPMRGPQYDRASYGHDVENVWLLMRTCDTIGVSNGPLLSFYQTVFWYSLRHGYDEEHGGFYDTGPFGKPADRRRKIWWVQSEGLVGALAMYQLTRDKVYLECFTKTLDWIDKHQVDWQNGDWFGVIEEDGTPSGAKADLWKSPYHNGRAMIECLERLRGVGE